MFCGYFRDVLVMTVDTLGGGGVIEDIFGAAQSDDLPTENEIANALDDGEADTLDGGEDDDRIYTGSGDVATGGEGADSFVVGTGSGYDVTSTITDFTVGEDTLVISTGTTPDDPDAAAASFASMQTVTEDGVLFSFGDDDSHDVLLAGLTEVLTPDSIQVVA